MNNNNPVSLNNRFVCPDHVKLMLNNDFGFIDYFFF